MPNYAQTNIPRSSRSKLVGILDSPVRPAPGTPWSDAGVDVRKRVYAVREPRSVATRFVTISYSYDDTSSWVALWIGSESSLAG